MRRINYKLLLSVFLVILAITSCTKKGIFSKEFIRKTLFEQKGPFGDVIEQMNIGIEQYEETGDGDYVQIGLIKADSIFSKLVGKEFPVEIDYTLKDYYKITEPFIISGYEGLTIASLGKLEKLDKKKIIQISAIGYSSDGSSIISLPFYTDFNDIAHVCFPLLSNPESVSKIEKVKLEQRSDDREKILYNSTKDEKSFEDKIKTAKRKVEFKKNYEKKK